MREKIKNLLVNKHVVPAMSVLMTLLVLMSSSCGEPESTEDDYSLMRKEQLQEEVIRCETEISFLQKNLKRDRIMIDTLMYLSSQTEIWNIKEALAEKVNDQFKLVQGRRVKLINTQKEREILLKRLETFYIKVEPILDDTIPLIYDPS